MKMKNIILVLLVVTLSICSTNSYSQRLITTTDTLGWLKTNIEQRSNLFVGNPLSVLLDSLYNLHIGIGEYSRDIISDGQPEGTYPTDTVWTKVCTIYFGKYLDDIVWRKHRDNPNVNTHIPYIYLEFTQKIPFPTKLFNDRNMGDLFGPVEALCRPYIVASIEVGEY
jgi:hypothetical protein